MVVNSDLIAFESIEFDEIVAIGIDVMFIGAMLVVFVVLAVVLSPLLVVAAFLA